LRLHRLKAIVGASPLFKGDSVAFGLISILSAVSLAMFDISSLTFSYFIDFYKSFINKEL
jgi:hypothetical protein